MNTEEKAKAYDEAVKRAKTAIDLAADKDLVEGVVRTILPELKENENERTRKEIIHYLSYTAGGLSTEEQNRWIAYLEKQQEKEKYDRMQPVYDNLDSFESALAKAWKAYNDSGSRTVDGCEDDYVECAHAKGFKEGYLFGLERQKEPENVSASTMAPSCWEVEQKEQKPWKVGANAYFTPEQKPAESRKRNKPKESWLSRAKYEIEHDDELLMQRQKELREIRELKKKEQHPSSRFLPGDWVVYDGPLGHAILQIKDVIDGRYSFVDNESTLLDEDSDKFLRPLTPEDVEGKQKPSAEYVLTKAGLKPYKDGNQWCILAGDNIQEGICGFGDTIEDALYEFLIDALNTQKEQKPLTTEETELNSIAFLEQMGYTCIPPGKEQKPAEWSEDYREEDIQTRFAFYTYKDDPSVLYLSNVFVEETSRNHGFGTRILKAAEKVAEAIGAITISLKVKQDSPVNAWYRKNGYGYVAFEDGYDWLEKNLEYLKPAKSAEWSEEDRHNLNSVISLVHSTTDGAWGSCIGDRIETWLKSLPERFNLQPKEEWSEEDEATIGTLINYFEGDALDCSTDEMVRRIRALRPSWKPSEEQMKALCSKLPVVKGSGDKVQDILETLYYDLKKLGVKEEPDC